MIEFDKDVEMRLRIPAGRYLTTREYADKYHMKVENVRQRVSRGRIRSVVFEGRRLIPEDQERAYEMTKKTNL